MMANLAAVDIFDLGLGLVSNASAGRSLLDVDIFFFTHHRQSDKHLTEPKSMPNMGMHIIRTTYAATSMSRRASMKTI
jgi:hypothetical protein